MFIVLINALECRNKLKMVKALEIYKLNGPIVVSELAFELLLFCVSGEWRMDDDDKDTTVEHKILAHGL